MSSSSNYERQSDNNVNQMSRSNRSSAKKKSTTAAPFLFLSNILKKKKILGFEEIREMNTRTRSEPSGDSELLCPRARHQSIFDFHSSLSLFCLFTVVSYSCSLPSRQPAISSLSLTPARLYSKKDMEYGKLVLFMFSQSLLRLLLLALVLVCSFDRPIKCHTLLCVGWRRTAESNGRQTTF